jgi:hypothetical protein
MRKMEETYEEREDERIHKYHELIPVERREGVEP